MNASPSRHPEPQPKGLQRPGAAATAAIVPAALALALVLAAAPLSAHAETYVAATGAEIEQVVSEYETARSEALVVNAQAAAAQSRVDKLQALMPAAQERADEAARQLYKRQRDPYTTVEMLIGSRSFKEFIAQAEYLQRIADSDTREITRMRDLRAQLAAAQEELAVVKQQADERLSVAQEALEAACAQRVVRQRQGVANAQSQAVSLGGEGSVGKDGTGANQPDDFRIAASTETASLNDGANWYQTEEQFVAEWAPRLNTYLEGSALAGQGDNFAKSAWKYNIDPRWSAAISNTESGKGAICIRPYNAWGWGAADSDPYNLALEWSSWEEAIDAHAKGLSEGYGYTITITGARAYCPNTWQSWYNKTLGEMSTI